MQVNTLLHGFRVTRVRELAELKAQLVEMVYEKNGAQLAWLDRPDQNMSFAIAFKTVPENDTGVFHILEHSVLCGSDKYPVKEPFVNLLRTSLQTFLNAMTFGDKTMYPVSSRNKKDFANLVDIYMDAVLHPAIYSQENIFRQEGWHYELAEDGSLLRNGVVYNEMKGAYASEDTLIESQMEKLLFPDSCYRHDSGGDPAHIPELTYEQFLNAHRRFYHPGNSRIFLDGQIDLDATLALLDGYLKDYGPSPDPEPEIPMQAPTGFHSARIEYEIAPNEDPAHRGHLAMGFVGGTFAQQKELIGLNVLSDVLCGSNEAPLKKALLEQGLAEDVSMYANATQQIVAEISIHNTDEEKVPQIQAVCREVLTDLARNGIPKDQIVAALNSREFRVREADFGRMSPGVIYAISAMDTWLYGGDPAESLCFDEVFAQLRREMDQGYFEKLLEKTFLENTHCAQVYCAPSHTVGEQARKREAEQLAALLATWDQDKKDQVAAQAKALKEHQQAPDSPEALATLPQLKLSDVAKKPEPIPMEVGKTGQTPVLYVPVNTSGIVYADFYFDARDLTLEELPLADLLASLLGQAATEKRDSLSLLNAIKTHLGAFDAGMEGYSRKGDPHYCAPALVVSTSMLKTSVDQALPLIAEVLTGSVLRDRPLVGKLLRQKKLDTRQYIVMSGNRFASTRAAAGFSASGMVAEALGGLENYRWLCKTEAAFSQGDDTLLAQLEALAKRLLCRARLTLCLTGDRDEALAARLAEPLPMGEAVTAPASYPGWGARREGFVIPAEVSFAAKGGNQLLLGSTYRGEQRVAASALSLDYLWNTIRVQGGAYGCGLQIASAGQVVFHTYRDPNAAGSLAAFDRAGDFLRAQHYSKEEIEGLILGTISDADPMLTPRLKGRNAAALYLSGRTQADQDELYSQILSTTWADMEQFADLLDQTCAQGSVCVIGGKALLDACGDALDTVEDLA